MVVAAQQPSKVEIETSLDKSFHHPGPAAKKQAIGAVKTNARKAMPGGISMNDNEQRVIPVKDIPGNNNS
jgi:hypothetical protein